LRFFETFKNLFSHSRAFEHYVNNNKRKLIKGLSYLPENVRQESELVYLDIFPDSTRCPDKWEDVFGVLFTEAELEKRRDILDSLWKINRGGQSGYFLEDILRKIDDNIRVIENIPVGNPRESNAIIISVNGNNAMVCGNKKAVNRYIIGDTSFLPLILQNDISKLYSIPNDKDYWETCFYVCKSVARNEITNEIIYVNKLKIESVWKNYIEYLVFKIKPVHTTAVLFIEWT